MSQMDTIAYLFKTPDNQLSPEELEAKAAMLSMAKADMQEKNEIKCVELVTKGNSLLEKRKQLRAEIKDFEDEEDIQYLAELNKEKAEISEKIKSYLKENSQAAAFVALEKSEKEIKGRIGKEVNGPAKEAGLKPIVNLRAGRKKGGAKPMDTREDGDEDSSDDSSE
jgi:phosphotransacetylase